MASPRFAGESPLVAAPAGADASSAANSGATASARNASGRLREIAKPLANIFMRGRVGRPLLYNCEAVHRLRVLLRSSRVTVTAPAGLFGAPPAGRGCLPSLPCSELPARSVWRTSGPPIAD